MASRSDARAFEGEAVGARAGAGPRVRRRSRVGEEMAQRGSTASMRRGGAAPRVRLAVPPPRGGSKLHRRRARGPREWNVTEDAEGERGCSAGSGVRTEFRNWNGERGAESGETWESGGGAEYGVFAQQA